MIKAITITNYLNDELRIQLDNPYETGLIITKIEGLGPVDATVNMSEMSTNDGGEFNSSRLTTRNIVMDVLFTDRFMTIEEARLQTYKFFPPKKRLKFEIETDTRHAYVYGYVESNTPDIFSPESSATISILCPSAYFESIFKQTIGFDGVDEMFEFPFSNESLEEPLIVFGELTVGVAKDLYSASEVETGIDITIRINGPAEHMLIYNATTEQIMRIDTDKVAYIVGSELKSGDVIYIGTSLPSPYAILVRDGINYNIFNALGKTIDWIRVVFGDNVFVTDAEIGTTNIQFQIDSKILYLGV